MFDEIRLPTAIEVGASGGPGFKTTILTLSSGFEKRNIDWQVARGRWNVGYGARDIETIQEIESFFYARQGRGRGFRFRDHKDDTATNQNIGTGDGADTTFQLRKQYVSGLVTYNRIIFKPVSGTLQVFLDGVETLDFVVDTTTGVVTLGSAPGFGVVVTATFKFDLPVRFDIDQLVISLITIEVGEAPDIPIIELRQLEA